MPSLTDNIGTVSPGIDLSGAWATGGGVVEPASPTVVLHVDCRVHPAAWVIQQDGNRIQTWIFPESFEQGVARKDPPVLPRPATGKISGVRVRIDDAESHYRLRYDEQSQHLRGTLNGTPFWAVRQIVANPGPCMGVP